MVMVHSLGIRTAALAALLFGASAGLGRGSEPAAPPLPDKKLTTRDIQLSVHARKALAEDAELGPSNLGVRVQNNVAILWGPVPSEALRKRAVEVVKKIQGVHEVKDADVYVAVAPAAVEAPAVPAHPAEPPTHTEAASPPEPATEPVGSLTARPAVESAPVVVLRPPLPIGDPASTQTVAVPPPEGLAAAVEGVRASEERFRRVDCRLDGDAATLRAGAARGEDVMAFARAISRLPGLARIVVQDDAAAAPR